MRIAGVASAFPKHYYNQKLLVEALKNYWRDRLPNPDILDRLDESMKVDGRYLVRPIDFYENMTTWGEANDVVDRSGPRTRRKGPVPRAGDGGPAAARAERDFRHVGHGHRRAVARCAARQSHGPFAQYQAHPDLRTWLRGRRRGNFSRRRLRARLSGSSGRAFIHRTVLAHAAARRSFDGASDLGDAFRRRRRGDGGGGIGSGIGRPGNSRHEIHSLSQFRTSDGLGHLRKGLPHRTVAGSSGYGAAASGRGCGRVSCGAGIQPRATSRAG